MWRKIKAVFAVSVVAMSLGMTISSSTAQDRTRDSVGVQTTTPRDNNVGFDFGWLGLVGLVGLAGLMPRDHQNRRDNDLKR